MAGFTDWQRAFEDYFKDKDVSNVAEFGLGTGTECLVKVFDSVYSVEITPYDDNWFKTIENKKYDNWKGVYRKTKDEYDEDIQEFVLQQIPKGKFDFVFVDPGVHFRPEIINLMFGRTKYIGAHDTSVGHNDYHWDRIANRNDYKRINYPDGQGTSFWEKK
jgi:hypothetical protein